MTIEAKSFVSTPTTGGDAVGREFARDHRFISLVLSLDIEGLLLGASLRPNVKVISSDPRQLGS
jgi:hypothetical protein